MRDGVASAHAILDRFGGSIIGDWQHGLGGVSWHAFWNRYGFDFGKSDTNNLSLATFVSFGGFTILFGGDMECAGWRRLLEQPDFRRRLLDVKVFVASHHGRESGKCEELFAWCRPELVIMSDGPKQYATQECSAWYANRTIGIPDYSSSNALLGPRTRKVMTTRRDGTVRVTAAASGHYLVQGEAPLSALSGLAALTQSRPVPNALGYYG